MIKRSELIFQVGGDLVEVEGNQRCVQFHPVSREIPHAKQRECCCCQSPCNRPRAAVPNSENLPCIDIGGEAIRLSNLNRSRWTIGELRMAREIPGSRDCVLQSQSI